MCFCQKNYSDYVIFILYLTCAVLPVNGGFFRNFNNSEVPPRVCSLLYGHFNISVTAVKNGVDIATAVVTSEMADIEVKGDCEYFIMLTWPSDITWHITEYTPVYEFTVSFLPSKVFPQLTRSSLVEIFDNPRKADLLGKFTSYKCSRAESRRYEGAETGDLSYRVVVGVDDIQVQVARLVHGEFSLVLKECSTYTAEPDDIPSESNLSAPSWLFLAFIVAPMVLIGAKVVLQLLAQNRTLRAKLRRFRRSKHLKKINKSVALTS